MGLPQLNASTDVSVGFAVKLRELESYRAFKCCCASFSLSQKKDQRKKVLYSNAEGYESGHFWVGLEPWTLWFVNLVVQTTEPHPFLMVRFDYSWI